ncbi:MAG: DUF72 domain-containing protein [Candidatus Aenigmatarchaeota archaeon]
MIYVGTCGFSEGMNKYFKDFKTVEIQQTFYKIIDIKTVSKWKRKAPKDFIFNLKAFQGITHPYNSKTWKRSNVDISKIKEKIGFLKPTKEVFYFWSKTLEVAKALDAKVILIQLPPSFKDERENWNNAERFFKNLDRKDFEIAVELREWNLKSVEKFCKEFDLIDVCDLLIREPVTNKILYSRLHGNYEGFKINYYYKYSLEDLKKIVKKLKKIKPKKAFIYFNNVFMLNDAKSLISLL